MSLKQHTTKTHYQQQSVLLQHSGNIFYEDYIYGGLYKHSYVLYCNALIMLTLINTNPAINSHENVLLTIYKLEVDGAYDTL